MQNSFEKTDIVSASVKKVWVAPALEIISKEIIKSGAVAGTEGASTGTFTS
jgi:hypothetical protein